MRQVLLETTSNILLVDPLSGDLIESNRPSVVKWTQFIEARVGVGQIRLIEAELADEASDEEFVNYLTESDGNFDLAVAAFVEAFKVHAPVGEKQEKTAVTTPSPAQKAPVKKDVA